MSLSRFLAVFAYAGLAFASTSDTCRLACQAVEVAISNASNVYYPGDPAYDFGKYHYAPSSEEDPACVVEPGTPEDLNVIAAKRVPFAVKSGGHTLNPGFSSTKGVHIYTGRFSQVTYNATTSTAVIGTGLIWDTVYERLQDFGVTVLGGRVTGIGVGGLVLGGGYTYKTNQYGLAIDTVVGFNLVLPNGTIRYVTESTHSDLFFGLKGGFNNFGIVTDFTLTTFPQTEVWGGQITYAAPQFDQVRAAISNFSVYSQDIKAAIMPSYVRYQGNSYVSQGMVYDAPTPPPGIFDNFTSIPAVMSGLKTRSYLDMILTGTSNSSAGLRTSYGVVGVSHFTENLLKAVEDELTYWEAKLPSKNGSVLAYTIEPFLQSYLSHANSPSAFPPPAARQPGNAPNPLNLDFAWQDSADDDVFVAAVKESEKRLSAVAKAEGVLSDHPLALYGNYAQATTPLFDIYGDNLPSLQALKRRIDPTNIMGLAGGFKF